VNVFIGVPWKGRNFKKAAREALDETFYDSEFLADRFNGRSKAEAKRESISQEFLNEVNQPGWQEVGQFIDTGRKSPRYGFDQVETQEGTVTGYRDYTFDSGFDEVYAPDDLTVDELLEQPVELQEYEGGDVETVYLGENSSDNRKKINLAEILNERVDDYEMREPIDDGVSLSAMVSEQFQRGDSIDKVLVSQDYEDISRSIADYVWDGVETVTFREYAEENQISYDEEEELIGDTPEIGGVYIVGSGTTAEDNNLSYERTADSYLRRWTTKPENSFKELEKTTA
jgi:hypothetical protein